jgi:tetratricopeptide (TPR) repeat protein
MRANRYLVAIVGVVLAVSFALPGTVSAQDEKYVQAYRAYEGGNFQQAETLFREVCAEYEDAGAPWGWCHMMLGITLGRMGPSKRQEALAQLEIAKDLVTTDGERYQTNFAIANIRLLDEDWAQAIAAANDAAAFGGADQAASIAKVKGQAYYQQQDWSNAASELETATEGRGGEANLYAWLGRSYFELGDKDRALPVLTQAAQIDRNNRIGLYFAARIHFDNQNYTQAISMAERAIQAHPQDTNIRNLLGMSYLGADRFSDAVQQFEVVIADRPSDATAIYNLGQAYLAQEQWGRAVEQFQKAQNLFPAGSTTQGALLYDLGIAFERLGRNEDALKAFTDSKAINDTTNVQDAIDRVQERIRRGKGGGGR